MNFICIFVDCKEAVSQTTRCIIKSVDISERRDMKICSDFFGSGGSPCSKSNCGVFRQHQEAIDIKVTRNVIYIQPNIHSRKGAVQSHNKVLHNSRILYSKLQYTNKHTQKNNNLSVIWRICFLRKSTRCHLLSVTPLFVKKPILAMQQMSELAEVSALVNGVCWECVSLTVMLGFCKPSACRGELRKMWLWGLIIWPSGLLRWKVTMQERRVQFPHCVRRADIGRWNTSVLPPAFTVVTLDSKEHTASKLLQLYNFTCVNINIQYTEHDKYDKNKSMFTL